MSKRRPLIEGVTENEIQLSKAEETFVYGETKSSTSDKQIDLSQKNNSSILPKMVGRVPITTRARPEIGSALKRASLQRQLDGVEPSTMQDIMEEALETWLVNKGYLEISSTM